MMKPSYKTVRFLSFLLLTAALSSCSNLEKANIDNSPQNTLDHNYNGQSSKAEQPQALTHRLTQHGNTFSYEGPIRVVVADNFEESSHEMHYQILDPDTQSYKNVQFDAQIETNVLNSTLHIQAEGRIENNQMLVSNLNIDEENFMTQFAGAAVNNRSIVYVRVNFSNGQQSQLSASGVTQRHDLMNEQYKQGTWGYVQFDNDPDNDGNPEIYAITLTSSSNWCNSSIGLDTFVPQARQEVLADHGVDINTFKNIILITPDMSSICGGLGGYAEFGSPSTTQTMRSIIVKLFSPAGHSVVIPHEVGHTMGLAHAADNSQTYGDDSSVMGNGSAIGFKTMSMNAVNVDKLQGFRNYPNRIGTVQSGIYTLYPLRVDPAESDGPQALRLLQSTTIYLSFRTALDFDANLSSSYLNQVSFHEKGTSLNFDSKIKETIQLGQTYNNPNNVSVKVTEIGPGNAYAKVEVTANGVPPTISNNTAPVANDQVVVVKHAEQTSYSLDYNDNDYGPGPYTYNEVQAVALGSQTGGGVYKTYTPPSNFIGTDTFKWTMNDDDKDSNEGTVTLKVLQPGEPSEAFDSAVLNATFGSDGEVTFNVNSGNAAALSTCDMQFGDSSSNETCATNKKHTYADGVYEACALLKDTQNKVMIACTQFNIVDGGEGVIPGNPTEVFKSFVSSQSCESSTTQSALGLLLLIGIVLLLNAVQTRPVRREA